MKLKEILNCIEVMESTASGELEIGAIAYDSRRVKPGDLFVAVRGFEADGHRFIPMAAEKGCAAVLCEEPPAVDVPYVIVRDSRLALALCAGNYYRHPTEEMTVIGVTGTNGKTTVSVLIKQMLEKCLGAKVGLIGSISNMIGDEEFHTEHTTPESLDLQALFRQMVDAGCTHCVMEVSSHSLVLSRVAGVKFKVGIFTNLTQDHLDFHKTMEEYARAKSLLFPMCELSAANADDPWMETGLKDAPGRVYTYSAESDKADLTARDIRLTADRVKFCALEGSELVRTTLHLPGKFSVYNALSVLSCARLLGIPLRDAADALSTAHGAATHIAHHRACEVVEAAVVCVVGVEHAADLVVFVEIAYEASGLPAPVAGNVGRGDVVAGAAEDVAEQALHHSGFDAEIEDSLLLAVVDSRKFCLVRLLLDNLELIDNLSGKVLGSDLRIVQEEGLSVDCYFADFLTVMSDCSVFGNLHPGDLLQKVLEHIIVCSLEGRGGKGNSVALHLDRISAVGDLRGFQLGSVGAHLDLPEIEIGVFYFDTLLELFVVEKLRAEDVLTVLDSAKSNLAVFFAEFVGDTFAVCGIVERDCSETYSFSGLRVL